MSADAVVLGAGIEGLAAAATLARAGRRVVLLDPRPTAGGIHAREEFHPGFQSPGLLPEAGCVRRELLADLGLERMGLAWRDSDEGVLVPQDGGPGLVVRRDPAGMRGALDPAELEAYGRWRGWIEHVRAVVTGLLDQPPPEIFEPRTGDLLALLRRGLQLRRLGERDMFELLRLGPSTVADWMQDSFTSEPLRVGLAAPALLGSVLGPRAPGTAALLLLRECALGREPKAGPAALVDALEKACRQAGVELHLGARVKRIRVERGPAGETARGVELDSGEAIEARIVLSTCSPARTLLELVGPRHLQPSVEHSAATWRARGAAAVLRVALSAPPEFAGRQGQTIPRAVSARSLAELERTADHLKYGTLPEEPWIDVWVPSHADPSLAPPGNAVLCALVHGIPRQLRDGWSEPARKRVESGAWKALARLAPGLRERVVGSDLLAPPELESRYGLLGGHVFEGELALDQLWIQRPAARLARYASPIHGLVLGGSASHPGGPFLGGAGVLAARAAIAR